GRTGPGPQRPSAPVDGPPVGEDPRPRRGAAPRLSMILRLLILWAVIASAIGLAVLIHRTRKTADGDDPLITGSSWGWSARLTGCSWVSSWSLRLATIPIPATRRRPSRPLWSRCMTRWASTPP